MAAAVTLLLDSNVLIDVLQGRRVALAWLEAQEAGFELDRLLTGGNPFKAA